MEPLPLCHPERAPLLSSRAPLLSSRTSEARGIVLRQSRDPRQKTPRDDRCGHPERPLPFCHPERAERGGISFFATQAEIPRQKTPRMTGAVIPNGRSSSVIPNERSERDLVPCQPEPRSLGKRPDRCGPNGRFPSVIPNGRSPPSSRTTASLLSSRTSEARGSFLANLPRSLGKRLGMTGAVIPNGRFPSVSRTGEARRDLVPRQPKRDPRQKRLGMTVCRPISSRRAPLSSVLPPRPSPSTAPG